MRDGRKRLAKDQSKKAHQLDPDNYCGVVQKPKLDGIAIDKATIR